MAVRGPIPNKLLIILDLDYTHYNTEKDGIVMLGELNASDDAIALQCGLILDHELTLEEKILFTKEKAKNWLHFYKTQVEIAKASGIQLVFGIVTNKTHYDDIVEHAVIAFRELLEPGHSGIYAHDEKNQEYCLIKQGNGYHYENLNKVEQRGYMGDCPFSPIIVVYKEDKGPHILSIAQHHGILPEHCLVLDDTPDVIFDAQRYGIRTVSFHEFCPAIREGTEKAALFKRLDDPLFVQEVLQKKRLEIVSHIEAMIMSVQQKRIQTISHTTIKEDPKDPFDILHSWGSYRLRFPLAKLVLSYSNASGGGEACSSYSASSNSEQDVGFRRTP
ncbi:hypothetical protein [Candidatus Berkiella aquae]|uniref:Uncharacterized protein n=1 Tax=Candidatus Berkiella aquae TaxID=295108 RepID=A0A0Q9YST9_9GAMM|nr:hypothetical protein [Candidatus Berkiella aquae]MCS5710780.1 hypothetical protein [Candidatus Berkiella aquae]